MHDGRQACKQARRPCNMCQQTQPASLPDLLPPLCPWLSAICSLPKTLAPTCWQEPPSTWLDASCFPVWCVGLHLAVAECRLLPCLACQHLLRSHDSHLYCRLVQQWLSQVAQTCTPAGTAPAPILNSSGSSASVCHSSLPAPRTPLAAGSFTRHCTLTCRRRHGMHDTLGQPHSSFCPPRMPVTAGNIAQHWQSPVGTGSQGFACIDWPCSRIPAFKMLLLAWHWYSALTCSCGHTVQPSSNHFACLMPLAAGT